MDEHYKLFSEAIKIIKTLNKKIYDIALAENKGLPLFELRTDGFTVVINFMDHQIWDSDGDGRELDEEKNEYESLEKYLKKETLKLIIPINDIKKVLT